MAIKITKNGTAGAQDRAPAAKTYQEGSSQGKASGRIKITKIERPQTAAKQKWTIGNIGQYGAGNIDLYDRPQYRNANGSISTVDSTSYNIDGQEVLLPTVWNRNGTPYHSSNDEEILQRYRDTGEYLGKFSTVEEANDYAEKLHLEQQERYPSSSLPAERGSKHKSGKEISQSIVRNEDAAKRIGAMVHATAQNLGANASGFLAALVAAAEEMDKEYRDAKEKAGVTTHADEMNPYPKTNEEITRGNRAGIDLLEGIADTQRAKAAQNIQTAKEGLGTAGRVGIDAFQIGMNLAGIVGANAILPGLGTAALGVSSGGSMANDYRQAQGENYNPLAGAGLAIGGAASVGVGGAAAKGAIRYGGALLNKLGLGNSAIAQNVLGALSDIAFAGGMSATNEYAKAAAYGDSYEDVAISGEELAKDMLFQAAVGFFCRTLTSSLGGKAEGATAQKAQREYFKDIDNLDDLTKAFKQYGRQYHPDRFATADAATQREMNDLFAKISAEYNAVKAELAVETAGRAAKAYNEQRTAKTPEAAQKAQATVKDEIAVMRSLVESGAIQAKEAVEAVQILDALAGEQTAGKPENPTADTAPERAAGTSENAPMPTSEEIGNQQTAQNSSPAQGADHSRQRVGGTVAPLGVSATQESKVSITPVGGKSKNDPLTQGKRVSLLQYANEGNAAEISERLNRGELAVDANGDLYRPKAEEHIDQRDSNTVGERRIKAFQFDHPEVHSFYKEAAADLMEELNYAEKGGGIVKLKEHGAGDDQYIRMKRSASERIAKLLDDEDISYADIERSISAIINDKGQENFAAAKRVELMLDNMLSNGYRDVHGGYHEPNADYLEAKQAIPGASETAATHEELPLWDIEEKNGGTTHGTEIKPAEPAEEGGADAVGAQSDLHGGDGGRRPYGDGAGGVAQLRQQPKSGSIERLHENVRRNRARTGGERSKENGALIQARQAAAALEPLVSSAEVGVSLGTDTKMLHILPRNAWDQELLDVEAAAKQAGISEVVMVTGLLQVNGGGSPVSITGVAERETNRIVMRVDSRKKTASELGLHEIAHFRSTRENVEAFAAAVQDSGDGWRDTLEEYRERYKGAANNYEGMTPEDADLYVWEEIMGDAYAGIDCFGQTASQYHTEAVRAIDGGSGAIPAQEAQRASSAIQKDTSAASERKTGPPARFSYAGRNANGANLESLREAQEMQAAGADMESIRKATGWHEGMDGKWRWEIDDSKMEYHRAGDALFGRNHPEYAEQQQLEQKMLYGELTDAEQARLRALTETWGRERSRLSERVERGNARLEDVLDHEELFRAYPQLRHVRVVFDETPKGVLGSFSAEGNQITISEELRDAPQDVLIHEIQHAIQNAEGFAKGSNRQYWEEKLTNGDEIQSKGFQEAREKLIQFQLDEANEEVLALRDQLEKAGELDDGFREYDRIWEEAERRGLDKKINEYYDLRENYYDQLHKPQRSVPSELYYNTAGEIEARDAANRRPMSSETRKRIKPDYGNGDTVFANGEDSYSVGETDDGRAVAVVDNDILSHIDTSTWDSAKKAQAKAAAKTALLAFEDGIQVNGITYKVNRTSRREYTRSEDTERLARRTPDAFADKMRAADIADDIITATTSWAKDGKLKHPRRDSFVDFTHGDVLIQAGANQYDAETVVGITADGEYVFYDVVDMTPTSFTTKKEPSPTAAGNNASSDIQESSSERSISRSTEKSNREISGVQPLSLPTLEPTTKTRFSLDEPVEETETLVAMHNMTEEKLRRTLDIGAWPSPSIAVVKAKEGHANYGEYSAVFPRETIDPQADSKNKVYGGDAWTPTKDNALVEREVNYEAQRAFDENIKNLSSQFAGGVFQGSGTLGKIGLENETRWEPEEIADKLANHPEVQAAFLQSEGKSLEPVYRDKQFDRFFSNATIQRYLDAVGEQEVARLAVKLMTGERLTAEEMKPAEQAIREVYAEEHANFLNRRPESKEKRIDYYMKNNVFPKAVNDIIAGKTKGDFADQSDFLTEKNGIDYLTNDKSSKITSALFWPLERMDYLISSIAVRGKYRKELDAGRSPKEAMKAADRWARDIMGTRSKGAAPLTFQSKNLIAQMVNMFQVEALNSWEHVTQDLFGPGLKEAEAKLGKEEAAKRLAGIIVATLLGAFLLNRVAEEGYGGTPAQFDVIGLLVGFFASGNGLSTNEQIATWIDDAWENGTGERLFGTDANAGNDEFDAGAATEDTLYNVSNDIPYLRNAAGLLGLGDQTLPMPDIYGTVTGTAKAVKDNGPFSEEVMRQLMGLAGDTLPGGRQAEKTYQGVETLLKGGYYKGSGEDERLQYPVSDDFWNVVQATMFGRNALSETRDFYAAGGKGLSAAQTRLYNQLVDMGADSETVYDAILAWKKIDGNDALSKAERETARFELVQSLPLTSEERELLHNTLSGSDTKYSAADEAKAQGIPVGTYQKFQTDAAALESDRDKDGNVIRNSKKEKVLKLIDSLPLNKAQKNWLYINEGYAESKLDETPWQ